MITAKTLTISTTTPSTVTTKVYDGTTVAAMTVGALDGLVAGEALGATGVVGTFADKNIGTKNVAAVYTLTDGANPLHLAGNYSLAGETLTGTITAKNLSVFNGVVTTKVYDGTDTAAITGAVLQDVAVGAGTSVDGKYYTGETVVLVGGTAGSFASKNVGAGQTVTTTMTLGGADAGNYTLSTQPTLTGNITAKNITMSGTVLDKVYDGNTAATIVLGSLTGLVGTEQLQVSVAGNAGTFSDKNVGGSTIPVTVTYTLADDLASGGLVSNYNLVNQTDTISGRILAKDLQVFNAVVTTKVYDGTTAAAITGAALLGNSSSANDGKYIGTETLVLGSGTTGIFASKNVGVGQAVTTTMTLGGADAGNYTLSAQPNLTGTITAKGLDVVVGEVTVTKVYDGTTGIANGDVTIDATTFALRDGAVTANDGKYYTGEDVKLKLKAAGALTSKDVGTGLQDVTTEVELDGTGMGNYALNAYQLKGTVTRKDLVVNGGGITVSKAYDGNTAINGGTDVSFGASALTGSSTGAADGKYIGTENVTLAVDAAGIFERSLPGTMIPISSTVKLASGNAVNDNYTLRGQPSGLKGEITGTATLNRNGAALNVNATDFLHVRNTTATRMQDGMTFQTTVGEVLIENSSFDGWMKRDNTSKVINASTGTTISFVETANVAVDSPVLRVQMEANSPNFMLLGDYRLRLQRDPDADPATANSVGATLFTFPGNADDPSGIGSLAPSADLVLRDSAAGELRDVPYDARPYTSLNGSGQAVAGSGYAPVEGEFNPDGSVQMSDLDIATASGGAAGSWNVTVDQPVISGEGKVTDVRLKYNNNTKVLIEGPDGVRLLNVKFEGMDEVDVRTTDLNNRVLMSATLLNDPDVTKMVVKTSQTLEAVLNSDVTFKEVKSLNNADLLAGVVRDNSSPTGFRIVTDRTLTVDGPGAAGTANVNLAGQLAIAAHTVVFNNANVVSGGVIDVRTRDGLVNRTYGSVVPGMTSFTGANGNYFLNTANSQSMTIGNSANILSALTGGQMRENGLGGATVMNVGRVQ
jgi:hypothetical protein